MPRILATDAVVPPYRIEQHEARTFVQSLFREANLDIGRLMPVFENTCIESRYFCVPPPWFEQPHGLRERNQVYKKNAVALAETAVRGVLAATGIDASAIGHIFFVSTTGFSTPSIDAYLFNRLGFRSTIRRTPIWGLGCGGGVAGLSRAQDWLLSYPGEAALVVSLELCGLTFIRNDLSKSNFVATALFGDGCGVALLAGDDFPVESERTIRLAANQCTTWEDSLSVMGWDITDEGLKVVFSRSIPKIVRKLGKAAIDDFLRSQKTQMAEIDFFLSHPGGAKVIQAYQESLDLPDSHVQHMRDVLRRYGNMSSATVFFVLHHFLTSADYHSGAKILSTALGPGFSTEMLLGICS